MGYITHLFFKKKFNKEILTISVMTRIFLFDYLKKKSQPLHLRNWGSIYCAMRELTALVTNLTVYTLPNLKVKFQYIGYMTYKKYSKLL